MTLKLLFAACSFSSLQLAAQKGDVETAKMNSILNTNYELTYPKAVMPQYFDMATRVITYSTAGKLLSTEVYAMTIKCEPGRKSGDPDEYTVLHFTIRKDSLPEVSVPSFTNWTYRFVRTPDNKDPDGRLFGIDHSNFKELKDSMGRAIPVDKSYHVYNSFIDFHTIGYFSEPLENGPGVQNLKRVGQKIVHGSAFSEPSLSMGDNILKGSVFKNGKVTLEFKGIGNVNKTSCAILGFDSDNSSFTVLMKPLPTMETTTSGASHYWGDIYKDIKKGWVQKATLTELVTSETVIHGSAIKLNSIIERSIEIKNITRHP